ncbi:MAG: ROK family protein [Chitinophagales bacterium]|nr:ROK family protein [Chitinophagales bacterium]MDW8392958.1 ROK family protein [Chitinophagales bacterium]
MTPKVVAGIDLGGTHTKLGLVSDRGHILWRHQIATTDFAEPQTFADAVAALLLQAAERQQMQLVGLGIGAPNGNPLTGTIAFAPNLQWKGTIPMVALLQERLQLPVCLTNDAKAAALGEKYFGAAAEFNDFIVITLGTGLGSGIFSGGRLVYGHDGFAGELGHVTIRHDSNRRCGCGRWGCLETYVSNSGLLTTYQEILQRLQLQEVHQSVHSDAAAIYQLAQTGFGPAQMAFEHFGNMLGEGLALAVQLLRPAAVFLTGGLSQASELFLPAVMDSLHAHVLPIFQGKIPVTPSALPPGDSAVLGAASLVWQQHDGLFRSAVSAPV